MYIVDTHAWIYYLLNKLPPKSNEVFISAENGDEVIALPSICLVECIHLIGANKIILTYEKLFTRFEESSNFIILPLNFEIAKLVPEIKLSELHDRVIVATAKYIQSPLITKDKEIVKSGIVKTIWG